MSSVRVSAEVASVFDALDSSLDAIAGLDFEALEAKVRLRALERLETARRRLLAQSHDIVAGLHQRDPLGLGGLLWRVLADWLRISDTEARRRIRDADQLAPRIALTGEVLAPDLGATADAWHAGHLDIEHLRVIQQFVRELPGVTPAPVRERAEGFLAEQATKMRPDQLHKLADRYAVMINPDGRFSDDDRARHRGFTWCAQRRDGMSRGYLLATPELRANLDAWLARFAAPGMCNPDDDTPHTTPSPQTSPDTDVSDTRTCAQRQHDALNALVRGQLGDPALGVHKGLPVTVIATTTVTELHTGTGYAHTAGATLLPMRDLIRMAAHAYHYLAVFDDHTARPLYLGRSRRIASPDQRIVLYARDRGCTAPGCPMPAYHSEVHHDRPWSHGGHTNVDELTLACHGDHKLTENGWHTTKLTNGDTQWIPPPQLGLPGATNTYHHPERHLPPQDKSA